LSTQFYHTPHAAAIRRHPYGDVDLFNKTVGGKVKKHPEKLIGVAGIDPLASEDPVSDLDRYVNE